MARLNGTIKKVMSDKGFGFVASDEGTEYFFHQSGCSGVQFYELREGLTLMRQKLSRSRGRWQCG